MSESDNESVPEVSDVLGQETEDYLQLKADLSAASNQVSGLRKSFKAAEKALVNAMMVNGIEEINRGGVRITRKRELKCEN